jgi:hypothetical protein
MMHEFYLSSVRDTLLVGVPFIAVLALGVFRLDTLFFATKRPVRVGREGCGMDVNGEPVVVDPDGRSSQPRKRRK